MRLTQHDRGTVVIIVATALMMLAGVAALALDGGMAYNERRSTQNAADNAALAGAWALCHHEDAVRAALDSAAHNEFFPPQVMEPEVTDDTVSVSIISEVDTHFGATQGVSSVQVVSDARARCTRGTGVGDVAIFTKGSTCGFNKSGTGVVNGLVYSASDIVLSGTKRFNGPVHSDGRITSSGSSIIYNSSVSSVEGYTYSGNPTFNGGPPEVTEPWNLSYPVDYEAWEFDIDDGGQYAEAAHARGEYEKLSSLTLSGSDTLSSGLYFVTGNVTISGSNKNFENVTIVARGTIVLSGNHQFTPYSVGLSLMSDHNGGCGSGITISGGSSLNGVIFAPNGRITISGNSVNGSVIGLAYTDSGSLTVTANSDYLPGGDPEVHLVD